MTLLLEAVQASQAERAAVAEVEIGERPPGICDRRIAIPSALGGRGARPTHAVGGTRIGYIGPVGVRARPNDAARDGRAELRLVDRRRELAVGEVLVGVLEALPHGRRADLLPARLAGARPAVRSRWTCPDRADTSDVGASAH